MEIRYLKHHEIDKLKWDSCIEQALNFQVYAYSWYLDITAPGWEALVADDYKAVFPLTAKKKIFRYLYQPFFSQQLGFFYPDKSYAPELKNIIKAIPEQFKLIDIYLNYTNDSLQLKNGKVNTRRNIILDLTPDYKQLHKFYSDHTKRNLKKAQQAHQQIGTCSIKEVVANYRKNKGAETRALTNKHYDLLSTLLTTFQNRNMLEVMAVTDAQKTILCSAAFLHTPKRIYYLLGSTHEKGKEMRSMFLMFNELISTYAETDKVLDFEGSEIPGVARFFKGFGAVKQHYYHLHINKLPLPIRWLKK